MSKSARRKQLWRTLPVLGIFIWEWEVWREDRTQPCYRLQPPPAAGEKLHPYSIDMWPLLAMPGQRLDENGILYTLATDAFPDSYHPTDIAQFALANWNAFLRTHTEEYRQSFMTQARWLVIHETRGADDAGGWPIPFPLKDYFAFQPWLSALTQGVGISTLIRAYQLSGESIFLEVARRAVRTFELDIRDGGVNCTIEGASVFFEEVAAYPAAHILNGYILSLFGLYDYVNLTNDEQIRGLIEQSLATLHTLIDRFDLGYGSCYDLLARQPTNRFYHMLHVALLAALAQYSGCEHCALLSARWATYQRGLKPLINHLVRRGARYRLAINRVIAQRPVAPVPSKQVDEKIAYDDI